MAHALQVCLLAAFPALVIFAAVRDVASFTIPNWISLAVVAGFAPAALLAGVQPTAMGLGLLVGLLALLAGMALFAFRVLGGGDAKLMAACGVWLGVSAILPFLVWTAVAGGGLAVALILGRKLHAWLPARTPAWARRLLTPDESVPYGAAIAVGALLAFPASPVALALAHAPR